MLKVIITTTFLVLTSTSYVQSICNHPSHHSGTLHFTTNLTILDNVREGQAIFLDCCAAGFDNILWYHNNDATNNNWIPWPFLYEDCDTYDKCPKLSSDNQTLQIVQSKDKVDGGWYMCVVSNFTTHKNISHTEQLYVHSCVDRGKPLAIPPHDVYTSLGQNATFHCAADFGCKPDYLRDVSWYIGYKPVNEVDKRYISTQNNRDYDVVVSSNLTVLNVQQGDLNVEFVCWISSDRYTDEQPKFPVKLKLSKIIENTNWTLIGGIIGGAVFVVAVVMIGALTLKSAFGPQIKYFVKSRIGELKSKGGKANHTLICHDENSNHLVQEITEYLEIQGYQVSNLMGGSGRSILESFGEQLDESASLIIVDLEKEDSSAEFKLFVESSLVEFDDGLMLVTVIKTKELRNSLMSSSQYKGLKRLEWPGNACKDRLKKNFYRSLQLRLPRIDSSSTEQNDPLLINEDSDRANDRLSGYGTIA